jgi:hypothetical protein
VMLRGRRRAAGIETARALAGAGGSETERMIDNHPGATSLPQLPATHGEILLKQLRENAKKDAEPWAAIVKTWLAQDKPEMKLP